MEDYEKNYISFIFNVQDENGSVIELIVPYMQLVLSVEISLGQLITLPI